MEQVIGLWVAALLTLMVYSFLIADNPLFRLAEHLLVGTALGYAALVVLERVLLPSLGLALAGSSVADPLTRLMTALGIVWGILLWFWLARPVRWLASWPLAIVFGVGSALAIGGILTGTLLPQVRASMLPLSGPGLLDNLVIVVVVLAGLTYFFFAIRPDRPIGRLIGRIARLGRWFLLVALGSFLGTRALSLLNALAERFEFLARWLRAILP
jgi:hypothetical protein